MSSIKRQALKKLVYISLGVALFFIVSPAQGPLKYLIAAGILFSGYHLLMLIVISQSLVDDLFPPKTSIELKTNRFDERAKKFTAVAFLPAAIFLLFQINKIDNTVGGMQLFWLAAATGIAVSVLILWMLRRVSPTIYNESDRRFTLFLGLPLCLFMFFPAAANFMNRQFADKEIVYKPFKVSRKSTNSRGTQYYVFCKTGNSTERFVVNRSFWDEVEEGKNIDLYLKHGLFGFDIVEDFKTVED